MTGQLIGVDVGGTGIRVASLEDGVLGPMGMSPTTTTGAAALIDQICEAVSSVRGPQALALGIGVPSVVEFSTGRVKSSVNVPLQDVPLRTVLGERLGLPTFVDNDATCAALAEAHEGDRLVVRDLVMFTVGTGVGGGLVIGGRIYRGATGAAGEVGHTLIGLDLVGGAPDAGSFPQEGSLEELAAGRALDALGAEEARANPDSVLGRIAAEGGSVNGRDVVTAAKDGDAQAVRLVELLGERLGIGIANAINYLDPEQVVIGGGVAIAGELLLEPARRTARRFVLPGVGEQTEIRLARHGGEAGVLGAALLARYELDAQTDAAGASALFAGDQGDGRRSPRAEAQKGER